MIKNVRDQVSCGKYREITEIFKIFQIYRVLIEGEPVLKLYIKTNNGETHEKIIPTVEGLFPMDITNPIL